MKRKRATKIALAVLCGAAISCVGGVFAAEGTTRYPVREEVDGTVVQPFEETLVFENPVNDYAVFGDTYAFAYSTSVYVLTTNENGERLRQVINHTSEVSLVDYDSEGNLYFKNIMGVTYKNVQPSPEATDEEHEFQSVNRSKLDLEEEVFYTLNDAGTLTYWHGGTDEEVEKEEGTSFSILKKYDNTVFALNNNRLYKLDGKEKTQLSLAYTDLTQAKDIPVGDVKEKLKAVGQTIYTDQIQNDCYYTEIDVSEIGETFTAVKTQKTVGDTPCLVLCESGNASIVAIGDKCYITAQENLSKNGEKRDTCQPTTDGGTYYAIQTTFIHATPFLSECNVVGTLAGNSTTPVVVKERFVHTVLSTEFCKVSAQIDGKQVEGFVAANFLTPYSFAGDDNVPTDNGDKEFSTKNNIVTVVLIVVIVALILIAVMYVCITSANKKNAKATEPNGSNMSGEKKRKWFSRKKTEEQPENNLDDPDEE